MNLINTKRQTNNGCIIHSGIIKTSFGWSGIVMVYGENIDIHMTIKDHIKVIKTFSGNQSFESHHKALSFAKKMKSYYPRLSNLYAIGFERF